MAQLDDHSAAKEMREVNKEKINNTIDKSKNSGGSGTFKFNAHAPEFVPRSQNPVSFPGYLYPYFQYLGDMGAVAAAVTVATTTATTDWLQYCDQAAAMPFVTNQNLSANILSTQAKNNLLTDELKLKIIKQIEYQFSDMSLIANENLAKQISKDPEGFVPISVVASTRKMKYLASNYQLIAQALRFSSKLEVSPDGKRVRRKFPFTEKEKEELQLRTIVAENLPDDHSHQNIEKIFNVVGSIKTIRVCHPQDASRPKGDFAISNKLHALVEYETIESAEKAVEKLNDQGNWRNGLRVRLLLRRSPKSVLKSKKTEFEGFLEDDFERQHGHVSDDFYLSINSDLSADYTGEDGSINAKKWGRGRGKPKPRLPTQIGRGLLNTPVHPGGPAHTEAPVKQTVKGPKMPDGTRGFTMGRGRPIVAKSS